MHSLGVYVSFPFCRQKCHFCDWVQKVPKADLFLKPEDDYRKQYVDSLCREIRAFKKNVARHNYIPSVIYWGGGTATTMSQKEIDDILSALHFTFDLSQVSEWTIEGSPDTVSRESLIYYREQGFNRLSLGVQSLNDQRLKQLGRRHHRDDTIAIVRTAQEVGFENISLDLMCGFSDETSTEIEQNIRDTHELGIKQLSFYTFRPTEGTMLRRQHDKQRHTLHPAKQLSAYLYGSQLLQSLGYEEYGVGYFGDIAENVVRMFGLDYDVVGFGSGATSILDGDYCAHTSGLLHQYISNPLQYDLRILTWSSNLLQPS